MTKIVVCALVLLMLVGAASAGLQPDQVVKMLKEGKNIQYIMDEHKNEIQKGQNVQTGQIVQNTDTQNTNGQANIINGDPNSQTSTGQQNIVDQISRIPGTGAFINLFESIYRLFMRESLPKSLDEQYKGSVPETASSPYLFEMLKMTGFFEGIVVNIQEKDIVNAKNSFNQFSDEYNKMSTLVPEWKVYFKPALVDQLGKDLNGNVAVDVVMKDIGNIGASCDRCHGNEWPQVWAKYYWRDFDTVNVNTPMGNMAWTGAMQVMAGGFDSITVNLEEGKRTEAYNSWQSFKTMLLNFKEACKNCHTTPRFYFVSDDVLAQVDQMGADIAGNVAVDQIVLEQQQLGDNCHRCHVIHQPPQRMKDKMEK